MFINLGFYFPVDVHTGPYPLDPDQTTEVFVGIPEIDAEHRQLVSHYNALIQALNEGDDVTAFGLSFYNLVFRVRKHFSSEELLMQEIGYPFLARHRAEHQKLLETADDFLRSVLTRFEKYDCSAVAKYFKYWLFDHVLHHDRALAQFAMGRACSASAVVPLTQPAFEIL
jgi:hemerythrin